MAAVLTYVGEDWVAQRLVGAGALSGVTMQYVGWGTGAGTAAKGDTTLFTEAAEARTAGTVSVTGSGATAKYQVVATIVSLSSQTITNAGAFSVGAGGSMAIHYDHTGQALNIDDSITYTFTLDPA